MCLDPAPAVSINSPTMAETDPRAAHGGSRYSAYEDAKIAVAICETNLSSGQCGKWAGPIMD